MTKISFKIVLVTDFTRFFQHHMAQTEDKKLGQVVTDAIIGTSNLSIDTTDSLGKEEKKQLMRCHFAIPFIDKTVTDKSVTRTTNIRKAFNSPFRPFLLSTTTIGQEGLDFHWYARKIVHWNTFQASGFRTTGRSYQPF